MTKLDRAHGICTYREGSKSTWFGKILPLYMALVGQYGIYCNDELLPEADYIRIRAKTQTVAEEKLDNINMEFINDNIMNLFGDLKPTMSQMRKDKLKANTKVLMLTNGYIIQAVGLNTPCRGALVKGKRPKMDIDDDVEDLENTKTESSRAYNREEVMTQQFGGLDQYGLTIYIANMVHNDCLMKHLLENPKWKTQKHQITKITRDNIGREVEVSDWESRFTVDYVNKVREFYEAMPEKGYALFRREYYNEIISDANYVIDYFDGDYTYKSGRNWVFEVDKFSQEPKYIRSWIVIGADPAISGKSNSSDGVVVVNAFGSDSIRRLLEVQVAKFDITDRFDDPNFRPSNGAVAISNSDIGHIVRRGMVDEIVRMIIKYNADSFVIENRGQQMAWFNEVTDKLKRLNRNIPGLPYVTKDDKEYKLKAGLMIYFSNGLYRIKRDMRNKDLLKQQIETFPHSKLDILDAVFDSEQMRNFPLQEDISVPIKKTTTYEDSLAELEESWIVV